LTSVSLSAGEDYSFQDFCPVKPCWNDRGCLLKDPENKYLSRKQQQEFFLFEDFLLMRISVHD